MRRLVHGAAWRALAVGLFVVITLFAFITPAPYDPGGNIASAAFSFPFGGKVIKSEKCHTPPNAYLITLGAPIGGQYIVFTPIGTRCFAFGCPALSGWALGAATTHGVCDTDLGGGVKNVNARMIRNTPGVGSSHGISTASTTPASECKSGIPFKSGVGTQLKPDIKKSLEGYCAVARDLDWQVTEGCPNTVSHSNPCHAQCTCVDIGFQSRRYSPERVSAAISAGNRNGVNIVFETNDQSLYQSLINAGLLPTQVKYYPQVTGSHFSYYCPTCKP